MTAFHRCLCIALLALGFGGASAQTQSLSVAAVPRDLPGAGSLALIGPQAADDYRISVHDLIEINVFQVAELSRTVRVNARGQISLPMIGIVDVGGLTAHEVEDVIAKRLAQDLLQDPQVTVFIKEFVSQRVIVEGKVKRTGVFPLAGRTTLLQAIAMAEGLDPLADASGVKIFRQHADGRREMMVYDVDAIRAGKAPDPQVRGNDVVVVEESAGRSMLKSVTDTLRGFIGFGTIGFR